MIELLTQIEKANNAGLHWVALTVALTIPDLCAAAESEDGNSSGKAYQRWVSTHLERWSLPEEALDLYRYRCTMLHQGSGQPNRAGAERVIATEPYSEFRAHAISVTANNGERAFFIDIEELCNEIISAARAWYAEARRREPTKTNLARMIQRRPDGLSPFVGGGLVIA